MRKNRFVFRKIKFSIQRIYRILNVKKTPDFVWNDLISYHKKSEWKFGQFDKEKQIKCSFEVAPNNNINFMYAVTDGKLRFSSMILYSFDEERTNDVLVLASHFNGLISFGIVKVFIEYNCVEFVYSRDLLTYSLYPGEINSDTDTHFELTKDVFLSFSNMIETGEDPVFVFSELMRRREEEIKEKKYI